MSDLIGVVPFLPQDQAIVTLNEVSHDFLLRDVEQNVHLTQVVYQCQHFFNFFAK